MVNERVRQHGCRRCRLLVWRAFQNDVDIAEQQPVAGRHRRLGEELAVPIRAIAAPEIGDLNLIRPHDDLGVLT